MRNRELFAFVAGPLVLAGIWWLPAWFFAVLVGVAVTAAAIELLGMGRAKSIDGGRHLAVVLLLAVLVGAWVFGRDGMLVAIGAVVVVVPAARLARRNALDGSLAGVALSCFVALYLGFTGACLGWIRLLPADRVGVALTFFFLITIWVGDSGAFYVGSLFGRHKMSPRISPNKTWEGLAGGVVATLGAAAAFQLIPGFPVSWRDTLALAVLLAAAAPIGDLVESLLKRDAGVKDSSSALPGHGGFLDRTDSLLFAAPIALAYLALAGLLT